ncbi:hypothetical protein BRC81_12905 [Halobacteriales archaeon QS_1_68_20]|nr:MAG: hypothetical protein BRC81_12905 [Halobacteriales archaeon QS_1_68_20]
MYDNPRFPDSGTEYTRNAADDGDSPISRRSVLKMTGSTAALAAAGATAVSGESYDTITVPADAKETIYVGGGETYENVLIDMTASGASAQIITTGSNWTVRDVGFEGIHPGGHYLLTPGVESSSGTGLIENVYLGDGQVEGSGSGGIWINANLPHRGTITFRNVHVAGMVDNGLYGSGVGAQGYCGNHHVEESYFYNNTISNNRTNAKCRRCEVYDTVVHVDGDNPDCGEGCSSPGSNHTRGFWSWYGETYLENVDVRVIDGNTFATKDGGYFTTNDVRTGSDADVTPPACVPSTAEDAADGSDCDDGGGGDGDFDEVAEDFSHDDVPGRYSIDTGAFTTTSARSTTDSYSLQVDDDSDGGTLIVRDDMGVTAGNKYELDVYHQSASGADVGFLFGAQDGATGWNDYTGYFGFFESDDDEIRVDRWEDGSQVAASATATTWPLDEWLTVELDYRDADDSTITMTVFDASGAEVASVSLADTTYDGGTVGWYNYHATSDWFADAWFQASDDGGSTTVLDDFEDGDISEYVGGTSGYQVQGSTVLEGSYSLEATNTYYKIAHADESTPRGYEYRFRTRAAGGSGAEPSPLVCVQDPYNPLDDCYWVHPDASAGDFNLYRRDGGSSVLLDSVAFTPQEDTTYEVTVELGADTVKAVLYDDAGSVVAETAAVSDATYDGGTFGFYTGGGSPGYYDYVTRESL